MLGGNPLQSLSQIVPQLLAEAGQVAIIQHEADIVLDHTQRFTGAVGRRINDAKHRDGLILWDKGSIVFP